MLSKCHMKTCHPAHPPRAVTAVTTLPRCPPAASPRPPRHGARHTADTSPVRRLRRCRGYKYVDMSGCLLHRVYSDNVCRWPMDPSVADIVYSRCPGSWGSASEVYCRNLSASHRKLGPGPTSAAENKRTLSTIKSWCFNLNLHELLLFLHWHTFVKTNWISTANSDWQTNLEIWQQAPGPTPECRQCHTEPRHAVCSPEKWTHHTWHMRLNWWIYSLRR